MGDREELTRLEDLQRRVEAREQESLRLREDVSNLRGELSELRREAARLRAQFTASRAQSQEETPAAPLPVDGPVSRLDLPPPLPSWAMHAATTAPVPAPAPIPDPAPVAAAAVEPVAAAAFASPPAASPPPPVPEPDAPAVEPAMDLETRIGVVWLNRLGLAALVIGVALFARYFHHQLLPWHKAVAGYAVATALFAAGLFLDKKHRLFARPVIAGGLAIGFFTSFAAGFLTPMLCLPLWASLALMTLFTLGIFACAEKWRSESTAGFAIVLGHTAAYVAGGEADIFSLVSVLFLSAAAMVLFLRHDWAPLNLLAVVGAYLSHFLWAIQDHPPSTPETRFWANCGFFAGYHAVFLASDLIFQSRAWRHRDRYTPAQRLSARAVLPVSLLLYSLFTAAIFRITEVYWDRIDLWLLPLAAVEATIALLHHRWRSQEAAFHALAAAAFVTLALFARFNGLTLNLALAAEAFLLLAFASRARIWYLIAIAQAALAVNFVHYWLSDASTLRTWPAFLGGVITGAVYLLGARLEQAWKLLRPLACAHAVMAGVLLAHQAMGFVRPPVDALAIAGFAAAITGIMLIRHVESFPFAIATLTGGLALSFLRTGWQVDIESGSSWAWSQAAVAASAACLAAALWQAEKLASPVAAGGAIAGLVALAGAAVTAPLTGTPALYAFPLALAVPAAFWLLAAASRMRGAWAHGIAGAALTAHAAVLGLESGDAALWLLAALAAALVAGVWRLELPRLLPGVAAHAAACSAALVWVTRHGPLDRVVYAIAAAVAPATAAGLLLGAVSRRRGSFAAAGVAALAVGILELVLLFTTSERHALEPPWAWMAVSLALWVAADACRRVELLIARIRGDEWRDRHHLEATRDLIGLKSHVAAVAGSAFWIAVLYTSDAAPAEFALVQGSVAVALLAAAFWLRSPPLAAAHLVTLASAFAVFILGEVLLNGRDAIAEHAGVVWLLTAAAIAAGVAADRVARRRPESRTIVTAGAWTAWAAALALGSWSVSVHPEGLIDWSGGVATPHWIYHAVAAALTLAVWAPARAARLVNGTQVAHIFLLAWSAKLVADLLLLPSIVAAPVAAAIGLAAMLVVVERWTSGPTLCLVSVVAAASCLLIAVAEAPSLQGVWTTIGWSVTAFALAALGFAFKDRNYRRVGLGVFGATVVRALVVDVSRLETFYRMLAFLGLGACLLVVSFLYTKFRDEVRKWI